MHTNRLFRENVYLRECDASIRSVSTREDKVLITLDQTIFFPTGGGQSCDLGTINDFAVVDVYEYEDDIFHCVACAPDALRVGDSVHLTLDWARRFDNMPASLRRAYPQRYVLPRIRRCQPRFHMETII